jgi:aminopeptidase N
VQKTTKQDFGWFFAQWTERGGVPVLSLQNVVQKEENGQYIITGQVVQEGKPYRLRLPVVLDLGDEKKSTETLEISEATTAFRYVVPSKATALRLDPAGNVLLAGSKLADEGANPLVKTF